MPATAVIGTQWGDEGKGRIVDLLAEDAAAVVRCQGGANAGHTVINHFGKFALHLIPSGIFSDATCVIGTGVAFDPLALLEEISVLEAAGVKTDKLVVSDRAHVVMPYHILADRLEEERLGKRQIGTTLKGIGPSYSDKVGRIGIQAGDLLNPDVLADKVRAALEWRNAIIEGVYKHKPVQVDEIIDWAREKGARLRGIIRPTSPILHSVLKKNQRILLEGQLGTMRDIDWGAYPYITTSSTVTAGLCAGSGVPPTAIDRVIGITKAYTTAVGSGPFPTELDDATGEWLRNHGGEFGSTTGRPRRCGWFDAVAVRYVVELNGVTEITLTKVDVLDGLDKLKVAVAYRIGGEVTTEIPTTVPMEQAEPIYEEFEGWTGSADVTSFDELPITAQKYISRLQELIGVRIRLVSIGPERHQIFEWAD